MNDSTQESSNVATQSTLSNRPQVFISYAREDRGWAEAIVNSIERLPDLTISPWIDRQRVRPGDDIDPTIFEGIKTSDIFLLLVSYDFIHSDYINDKEMPAIVEAAKMPDCSLLYATIEPSISIAKKKWDKERFDFGNSMQKEIQNFLNKHSLDSVLAALPLDDPLQENSFLKEDENRNGKVRAIVNSIRRNIDPIFPLLERRLNQNQIILSKEYDGETSTIYRVSNTNKSYDQAFKVLKKPDDYKWFQSALKRATSAPTINNIVPVNDTFFSSNLSYCTSQYIEGDTLSHFIETKQPLSIEFMQRTIRKIGQALIELRRERKFRNVAINTRPNNILIETDTYEPFLSLAVRTEDRRGYRYIDTLVEHSNRNENSTNIHQNTAINEAWAYLIPEYLSPRKKVSRAEIVDQYNLGLIAFQILTGLLPTSINQKQIITRFNNHNNTNGTSDFSRYAYLEFSEMKKISEQNRCFDHTFPIIQRMVSIDPDLRYPSLREALQKLANPKANSAELVKESLHRCLSDSGQRRIFLKQLRECFTKKTSVEFDSSATDCFVCDSETYEGQRAEGYLQHVILSFVTYFERHSDSPPKEPTILSLFKQRSQSVEDNYHYYRAFRDALIDTVDEHDAVWIKNHPEGEYWHAIWKSVFEPGLNYLHQG